MLGHECVMLERIQLLFAAKTGHGNAQPIAKWKSHFPKSQFAAVSSQKKQATSIELLHLQHHMVSDLTLRIRPSCFSNCLLMVVVVHHPPKKGQILWQTLRIRNACNKCRGMLAGTSSAATLYY